MRPEKWENLINDIKDKFEVEKYKKEHSDEMGGTDIEYIIFKNEVGRMKLEFTTRPLITDKKTNYAKKRMGGDTGIEYTYDPEEKTYKMKAYKWDEYDNEWIEMDAKNLE